MDAMDKAKPKIEIFLPGHDEPLPDEDVPTRKSKRVGDGAALWIFGTITFISLMTPLMIYIYR